jgi:hypothetical protein
MIKCVYIIFFRICLNHIMRTIWINFSAGRWFLLSEFRKATNMLILWACHRFFHLLSFSRFYDFLINVTFFNLIIQLNYTHRWYRKVISPFTKPSKCVMPSFHCALSHSVVHLTYIFFIINLSINEQWKCDEKQFFFLPSHSLIHLYCSIDEGKSILMWHQKKENV